ncbi:hypothetical protein J7T55_010914 [Diaporthe amygdali]|uniref:uncharacterized protein n=1 Tax=Phomopsis amygdali TaxID=1214568 RepID=UPI0022FEC784|nr:uncharacterized protein J7T55_010914 [Diaporthe amygdali]KAJ0104448.1 hypothetical protein J7T55_010914 [Diaporthe amygdali]
MAIRTSPKSSATWSGDAETPDQILMMPGARRKATAPALIAVYKRSMDMAAVTISTAPWFPPDVEGIAQRGGIRFMTVPVTMSARPTSNFVPSYIHVTWR